MQASISNKSIPLPSRTELNACEPPTEIRVGDKGASLTLNWRDGRTATFQAPFLRDNSQSARSKKLRLSRLAVPAADSLTIDALRPIGAYAVNIVFSDGYDRGIYPWAYLLQLAGSPGKSDAHTGLSAEDFLICN